MNRKISLEKHLALLKAAGMTTRENAAAQAAAARAGAEEAAEVERNAAEQARQAEAARFGKVIDRLGQKMAALSRAIEQMGSDSAERTKLVQGLTR